VTRHATLACAVWLALTPLPALAFTPVDPEGAERTAQILDRQGQHMVATGAAPAFGLPKRQGLDGTRLRLAWRSAGRTARDLLDDLTAQLDRAGFTALFSCQTETCGGFDFRLALPVVPMPDMFVDLGGFRYLSAARDTPQALAEVLVSQAAGQSYAQISVISAAPPRPAPPAPLPSPAPASAAMAADPTDDLIAALEAEGRVVLPRVRFAAGSADLDDDAQATLSLLTQWLQQDPDHRLALVGHSDWTGTAEANLRVSRARAQAVADALVRGGVARARLTVAGSGPFAPISDNRNEDGRAANRRVEAVVMQPAE